jgi:voltage-gated potassium channel
MNESFAEPHSEKLTWLQVILLVLSIYVLTVVFLQTVIQFSPQTNALLDEIDSIICAFFLYDFFLRLYRAPSKRAFLRWGWLDLISSIPVAGIFRWARIARVVRLLRILRAFRSSKVLIGYLFEHRAKSVLATVSLISAILVIFSSIIILHVETDASSNIKTPSDAIWWSLSTITTVGYGDRFPVTNEGRLVAVALMVVGVGLFATFTAYISNCFIESGQKKHESEIRELANEVRSLREKLDEIIGRQE